MPNLAPLDDSALVEFEDSLAMVRSAMGFVPNSLKTMAIRPELFSSFLQLAATIQRSERIDPILGQLVAHVASTAAGCSYCQAHTGAVARNRGADADKILHAWEFETDDRFSSAERAALRLARDAALVPNRTTPEHFEALRQHFDERQIVDLVAIVSLFGFLNRWNDTMATELEQEPREFAEQTLSARGWSVDKHA